MSNPSVHIPSVAHQCRAPTTHQTSTYIQSHQRNHHYRDCLYNIRHNTEHKYIKHGVNITQTPWTTVSSLPIPDTTYPKKEPMSPPRIRHCRLPHSPKHPGTDTGEDPHHQKASKCTVDHAHKALFPPRDEVEHDTPIVHRLIGAYRYDSCIHLCQYGPCRRCRGVDRG